jgi:ATP-dependent Clp protease adaptor protein ClpS
MSERWTEKQGDIATEQETRRKVDRPRLFKVLLHNDNYTTMEFVVMVLMSIFRKPEVEAVRIMLDVHHKGLGLVGVYPHEVAETRAQQVMELAKREQFPLLCTLEPE